MKTSELVKQLNNINGIRAFNKNFISVINNENECLAKVGTFGIWIELYNCPHESSKLLFEYYLTPLEEREEEKKYILKFPKAFDSKVLSYKLDTQEYARHELKVNANYIKTSFTQKEIDAMPFDTNFFIKEEV